MPEGGWYENDHRMPGAKKSTPSPPRRGTKPPKGAKTVYKRLVLKLSGEVLASESESIDSEVTKKIAEEVAEISKMARWHRPGCLL